MATALRVKKGVRKGGSYRPGKAIERRDPSF